MTILPSLTRLARRFPAALAGGSLLVALGACEPPFNLAQPTTRALEAGASETLSAAKSFEITGTYTEAGVAWTIDMQAAGFEGIGGEHLMITSSGVSLEAIVVGSGAYFRGQQFLSEHMGADPLSRSLVQAAGSAWWEGSTADAPRLPELTDATIFTATFLGPAVTQRLDHQLVDGQNAVDLSGPRADVYVSAESPYRVLRVRLKKGVLVDGISEGDLRYSNFDKDFRIAAPTNVIDFSNLSTLPPVYSVEGVDTSACTSPCVVTARLRNLGGVSGAKAPSTITFTMTDPATGQVIGTCQVQVAPDVGYNASTSESCTIPTPGARQPNAAIVTAVADNPGRA